MKTNGEVYYRLHHELTIDDVEFLAKKRRYIMEAKKYDWLLKLIYVTDDRHYNVSYVSVIGSTKNEVMHIVDKYRKEFATVRVYKFQPLM